MAVNVDDRELAHAVSSAYSNTGAAWQRGPGRVYDRLADVVVAAAAAPVDGRVVLDLGSGTGAASRAASRAGASMIVAVDGAWGVLAHDRASRPPAVVGDAQCLPLRDASIDVSVAAFALNHLTDPAAGLREMVRVTRRGGCLVAASYAADDTHPVKAVIEELLRARGWEPPPWYLAIMAQAAPLLATIDGCRAAAARAGLDARVSNERVPFPDLTTDDLVAWRLGMAHCAPFVEGLADDQRRAIVAEAVTRLAGAGPLTRSILILTSVT